MTCSLSPYPTEPLFSTVLAMTAIVLTNRTNKIFFKYKIVQNKLSFMPYTITAMKSALPLEALQRIFKFLDIEYKKTAYQYLLGERQ